MDATTLTFYNDRATFDADFPDLPLEDFKEGNVSAGGVRGCSKPVDENTNNRCFVPGDIEPGVSFTTPSGSGIVLYGAGFGGATSKNIVANRATDPFIIDFTAEDVTAVGMDITAYFNGDPHTPSVSPRVTRYNSPGDLVQLDTLDVRPVPGIVLKHFTARDVVSRWDVVEAHTRATATTAAGFLDALQARMALPSKGHPGGRRRYPQKVCNQSGGVPSL